MKNPPLLHSKLPQSGNSIFSEMTALANRHGALNLSQGFPDYAVDPRLVALVAEAMKDGFNQYAPMPGVPALRERIAEKYKSFYGLDVDYQDEITITSGATQAIFDIIGAMVENGDEVIIFEPAYDSYAPSVQLFGGKVVPVQLYAPDFKIDWDEVKAKMSNRTKMIIINNPGNPSGTVWKHEYLLALERLTHGTDIFVLSDEVYEHLVFDGQRHLTVALYPELRMRSFVVASFGKLLHSTGWKLGYCIAPKSLTAEVRKVHQFNVFSANMPMQVAIAKYLDDPDYYGELSVFFQRKRDFVISGLRHSKFNVRPSQGSYFLLLNYGNLSDKEELDYAVELTEKYGVALIPTVAFYHNNIQQKTLRLCFAKKEETLAEAVDILCRVS